MSTDRITVRLPENLRNHPALSRGRAGEVIRQALAVITGTEDCIEWILKLPTSLHMPDDRGPCLCQQCTDRGKFREIQASLKKYLESE